MAKRSSAKAINGKQSSAYKGVTRSTAAIHHIDGSSKREISRIPRIKALRSWTLKSNFVSEAMQDAQAEKQMNPHGWSSKKNPICPSCFIQKSVSGACTPGCNA